MREYKLHELKSSNILYNKKDPKMGFMIIGITLIFLIGLIAAANFVKRTEVVRSSGILSTTNKTYIMSETGGRISKVHKKNGEFVNEGDLILELDNTQVQAQILSLDYKLNYLNNHINNLNLFIDSLESFNYESIELNENPFDDGEFYLQYNSFLKSLESIEETKLNDVGDEVNKEIEEITKERKDLVNQYLPQYYSQKGQYEYEISGILGQKDAYELTLESYKIYASSSGYINYSNELNTSLVIGNDPIGTINDALNIENSVIEVFISTSSINHISVNQEVDISVIGLPQIEHGVIKGKVTSIGTDSIVLEEGVYYKVNVAPSNIRLNDIKLISGQATEIRIKYEELTYLKWIINKLGLFNT